MSNIVLRKEGDSVAIPQAGMELSEYTPGETKIRAILQWNAEVDLDAPFTGLKMEARMDMFFSRVKAIRIKHLTFI